MEKNKRQSGFSLLEILVAVTIMGLAYVAILQNFSMSTRSIVKMDAGRTELLASAMAFERMLLSLDQAEQGASDAAGVLAEGGRYQLIEVIDENDDFMTLKLKKK
ncbi:MAG: type II secretion system protein [Desulfobulbaceae bacterium]|nr:type II secretion system protein [Desulfobulbaceae bacterium]